MNLRKVKRENISLWSYPGCLASRKASSSESVKSSAESVKSEKSEKSDNSGISRANSIQAESVKGDESTSEPVSEPTVQEEGEPAGDASEASGSVAVDDQVGDDSNGDEAADKPAVSFFCNQNFIIRKQNRICTL